MATDTRQMLVKFAGDLAGIRSAVKETLGLLRGLNTNLQKEKDSSASSSKQAHAEEIQQLKDEAALALANSKAKQAAIQQEAAAQKAAADARIQEVKIQEENIRLERQRLALVQQREAAERRATNESGGGEGGLGKLLTRFTGAAAGGGGILTSLVAGAAGGGAFFIFEKLAETLGDFVKKLIELPTHAGEVMEKLEQMSARAGVTTRQFQELKLAGSAVGISGDELARTLNRMQLQFTRTSGLVNRVEAEMKRFGVSIRDASGNILPSTEILKRVSDLFQQMPDGMTKSRLAADLFTARLGSQMIPILNQGGAALQNLYDEADKYAIQVNEETLKAQRAWNVETEKLSMQWEKFKVELGEGVLPILVKLLGYINGITEAMIGQNPIVKQFGDNISNWATQQAAMAAVKAGKPGKFTQQDLTPEGRQHLQEQAPRELIDQFYRERAYPRGSNYIAEDTWEDVYRKVVQGGSGRESELFGAFSQKYPDAFQTKKPEPEGQKLDPRLRDTTRFQLQEAKTQDQIDKERAKGALAARQEELTEEQKLLEESLKAGETSLSDYIDRVKKIYAEQLEAKKKEIDLEAEAQKKMLKEQLGLGRTTPGEYQKQIELLNLQTNDKKAKADDDYRKQSLAADMKRETDRIQAQKKSVEDGRKLNEQRIAEAKDINEKDFKNSIITDDAYLEEKKRLAGEELSLAVQTANDKLGASDKGLQALQQRAFEVQQAQIKYEKELTDITKSETETRMNYSTREYQNKLGIAQTQLGGAQLMSGGSGVDVARQAMQQIIAVTQQYITQQQQLLKTTQDGSTEWYKILESIMKATQELQKMNQELLQSRSALGSIGGILPSIGEAITSGLGGRHFGMFGTAGQFLSQESTVTAQRTSQGQSGGVLGDMVDAFKSIDWHDLGKSLQSFTKGIQGAIGALGSLGQVFGTSQGHFGDIASGAAAGAGLGQDIGSMFSKFSKMAGPIGEIAGMAFGGILSGIIGQKNNQAQDFLNKIHLQDEQVMAQIQDGTLGLAAGISELQQMRQSVLQQMNSSKKKQKSMFQQAAQSLQDQIIQLQQQQQAMMIDLQNQVSILNSPEAFQPLLNNLYEILQQYNKFAGAAQNAQQLAQANQWLAGSLQNFATTEMQQLNQAEQQAIQDALQLNTLLMQRQELLTNEAQTEYDIMSQGVLVNQRTVAQQKVAQIQQARNQLNLQLDQMNQEISITEYKVQAEQKIFNLATTRIGLEAQLLALQEQQTNYQLAQVVALASVLGALQNGTNFTAGNITTILNQLLSLLGLSAATSGNMNPASNSQLLALLNNLRGAQSTSGFGSTGGYIPS